MVTVKIELEVPDSLAAGYFEQATRNWCSKQEGWKVVSVAMVSVATDVAPARCPVPLCPECDYPMRWSAQLQTYVCGHVE